MDERDWTLLTQVNEAERIMVLGGGLVTKLR